MSAPAAKVQPIRPAMQEVILPEALRSASVALRVLPRPNGWRLVQWIKDGQLVGSIELDPVAAAFVAEQLTGAAR